MRYREFQPRTPVDQFVECIWTLESDQDAIPTDCERILPDGCVELIFNFGTPFSEHKENGVHETQPAHFLVGQMTKPIEVVPTGRVQIAGVRFHPVGTLPFFDFPMSDLTNKTLSLDQLDKHVLTDLIERVGETSPLKQKVFEIEKWLAYLVRNWKIDSKLFKLTRTIVREGGQISIDKLAADSGISSRQLERRFLKEVGIGPKQLCRILRFQQVFRAIETNPNWAAIAVDCGYYDQAHLIRDFRQFAGQTPSVLFSESQPLTQYFSRKNRTSHFYNTKV